MRFEIIFNDFKYDAVLRVIKIGKEEINWRQSYKLLM